jgi:hypothetical protein
MLTVKQPQQQNTKPENKSGPRAVKQYRKQDALVGKGVYSDNLIADKQPTVQPKYYYSGFSKLDVDFKLLQNTLLDIKNKYTPFFQTDFCDIQINLDHTKDENPGDACSYIKKKGNEKYDYANLNYLREGGQIEKLFVRINIRKWFYDGYDTGKILSMIAHEVGVHVLPYMDEYLSAFTPEIQEKLAYKPPKHIDTEKTHGERGINDHIRVADPEHEDFYTYRSFVNQMAEAVLADQSQIFTSKELRQTAQQLTDAYLMDIATFTGTGDRLKYPFKPQLVANKYNNYLQGKPKLIAPPDGRKKGSEVSAAYNDLYKKAIPIALVNHKKKTAVLVFLALGLIYYIIRLFLR